MRSDPERPRPYKLTFLLPREIRAHAGRHQPCADGCAVTIGIGGQVTIEGPTRDAVIEQGTRFLRVECRGRNGAFSIAALIETPSRDAFGRPFGVNDSWLIIVGADIAFAPTSLDPVLPGSNVVPIYKATG